MSQGSYSVAGVPNESNKVWAVRFLLLIAGLGGLLYGIDVGIIAGALPYLEATSRLNAQQLSFIVAAVLLGSVISTLFAGMLADWLGRKKLMAASGLLFVISIPMIAAAAGDWWYWWLLAGRLLQGISAGLVGVVVPLYLAECLTASQRGKGTAIFQWLLTLGIVVAAVIGYCFSLWVDEIEKLNDADKLFAFKDVAWRSIFWVSLPPGLLFLVGSLFVPESSRWLFRRGKKQAALAALLCSRTQEQAEIEMKEMEETIAAEKAKTSTTGEKIKESLLHRKYVIPFILACIILACTQATGVNSVISYNTTILIQAGLERRAGPPGLCPPHRGELRDDHGRHRAGGPQGPQVPALAGQRRHHRLADLHGLALPQHRTTANRLQQCRPADGRRDGQKLNLTFNEDQADKLLADQGEPGRAISGKPYEPDHHLLRSAISGLRQKSCNRTTRMPEIEITRDSCVPANKVAAFFSNPFADLDAAQVRPAEDRKRADHPRANNAKRLADRHRASTASWRFSPWGPACACGWRSPN